MGFLLTIAAFIVALSILIVVHEYGHYWVAQRCNVKVLRFSVGFGKPIWSKTIGRDETEWVVAAIPLGGFVKMLDERDGEVAPHERDRAFNRKTVWQRFAIVLAGPVANFLAAILLYWALYLYGTPGLIPVMGDPRPGSAVMQAGFVVGDTVTRVDGTEIRSWQDFRWIMLRKALDKQSIQIDLKTAQGDAVVRELGLQQLTSSDLESDLLGVLGFVPLRVPFRPVIGELSHGGAGTRADLQKGDLVLAIDGAAINSWDALVAKVRSAPGKTLLFRIKRGDVEMYAVPVTPEGVNGQGTTFGRIGASPAMDPDAMRRMVTNVRYGPVESFERAAVKTWETAIFSLRMLGKMVVGEVSLKNLSGPITIADYAGQSAQNGWVSYLLFLALISISLGVLNLLPVPLLDGGHLMYYSIEIITGKPVSEKIMEAGQHVGMAMLFALMIFALYNDINRLIGS